MGTQEKLKDLKIMTVDGFKNVKLMGEETSIVTSKIFDVVIEKNKRYGDSALSPINLFSKLDNTSSILIRLDDKISRIKNADELRMNDITDVMGYLILYILSDPEYKEYVGHITDYIVAMHIQTNKHGAVFNKHQAEEMNVECLFSIVMMDIFLGYLKEGNELNVPVAFKMIYALAMMCDTVGFANYESLID